MTSSLNPVNEYKNALVAAAPELIAATRERDAVVKLLENLGVASTLIHDSLSYDAAMFIKFDGSTNDIDQFREAWQEFYDWKYDAAIADQEKKA